MRLTRYSDYAMRVLIYLAARDDRLGSIGEIARTYDISHNHLMKVVHDLGKAGFIVTVRGRNGGIRLARPASEINLADVIRHTEESFELADCANCFIMPACGLTCILDEAMRAFMRVFESYTLADALQNKSRLMRLFDVRSVDGDADNERAAAE